MLKSTVSLITSAGLLLFFPVIAAASASAEHTVNLTGEFVGYAALAVFIIAYIVVMSRNSRT